MHQEIVCAGFGGQGVLLIGQTLAYAGMLEGKEVSWYPAYGPEMRGGTANCTTVIAESQIGSPVTSAPTVLVALNRPSLEKFYSGVVPEGFVVYNSSLIDSSVLTRSDLQTVGVDANNIASQIGNSRVANMVMLGAVLALTQLVSLEAVEQALRMVLPSRRHNLLPLNYQALQKGVELVGA